MYATNIFFRLSFFGLLALGLSLPWQSPNAEAAGSATARASANVVTPLHVKGLTQLDFGILLPGSQKGEVKVTPTFKRHVSGRVTMFPGIFAPASFTVKGVPDTYYTVSTPSSLVFRAGGLFSALFKFGRAKTSSLHVKDFTTYSQTLRDGGHRGLLGRHGRDRLSVGGTLVIPPDAAPGHYTGYVPISISYQ
jgi:hypothetical protein